MVERKLYKTKLCVLYERGRCSRQNCSFAHGNAELRRFLDSSYSGRWDNRGSDLRDKLDRRLSLERRYSPGRDGRGRQTFGGYSPSKSLEKKREREHKEKQNLGGESDYPGSLKATDRIEERTRKGKKPLANSKNVIEEELKGVQSDVSMLERSKVHLRIDIEEKVQEADSLTSRIQELEAQLDKEKEECNRISSKIKKFVKAHNRFSRVQDELRRSQTRLQKLGDQLGSDFTRAEGNDEDLSINIVSDVEAGHRVLSPRSEMQNYSSLNKKRLRVNRDAAEESIADECGEDRAGAVKLKKLSRWNMQPVQLNVEKEVTLVNNGHTTWEDKQKTGKHASFSGPSTDKLKGSGSGLLLPSTSMAAYAIDEVIDIEENVEVVEVDAAGPEGGTTHAATGLPFPIPIPLLVSRNTYSQHEGEDENVDVDG